MLANIDSELSTIQNGRYGEDIRTAIKDAISKVNNAGYMPVVENLNVVENGTYTPSAGVNGFSKVVVNVPSGSPVVEPLTANSNGVYTPSSGVDGYSQVTVSVPGKTLIEKLINTNGTYSPSSDNADGYNSVIVDVPSFSPTLQPLSISSNGVYTPSSGVDGYSQVTVAVYPGLLPTHYFDLDKGYVSNGKWTIGGDTVSYSDVYQVIAGHSYFITLGDTVGTRFRVMFSEADTSTSTGNIMGTSVYNTNNPEPYSCTLFLTAPNDGFLTITKDNAGLSGLKTYVFRVDELAEGTSSGSGDTSVLIEKSISENGSYNPSDDNADGYSSVTVNVQIPSINLQSKTVTENGVVTADNGYDGLSSVTVNVDTNFGISVDEIAMRTISGAVSGNASFIGSYAFSKCSRITEVSFPACTNVGYYAFPDCTNLMSVSFPSCISIGSYAFRGCKKLTTVSFPACTNIGWSAFYYCSGLISVNFPVCTTIENTVFCACTNLTNVSFPVCTTIGSYAFQNCKSLTSVSFPFCITIGNYAFQLCWKLLSIYLTSSSICALASSSVFMSTPIAGYTIYTDGVYGSIYVPESLLDSYKSAANWSYFSDRFVGI